jgi:hypothetical protein
MADDRDAAISRARSVFDDRSFVEYPTVLARTRSVARMRDCWLILGGQFGLRARVNNDQLHFGLTTC